MTDPTPPDVPVPADFLRDLLRWSETQATSHRTIDAAGYRERRRATLEGIAMRAADRARSRDGDGRERPDSESPGVTHPA